MAFKACLRVLVRHGAEASRCRSTYRAPRPVFKLGQQELHSAPSSCWPESPQWRHNCTGKALQVADGLLSKAALSEIIPLRALSTSAYHRPSGVKKHGIAHVQSTFSNTVITLTDLDGNTKSWSSAGSVGFKGSRRATKYAAQATAEHVAKQALQLGFSTVEVRIKGISTGKDSSVRGLQIGGLGITKIRDVTPAPHNGCRAPKKRRV